MKSIPSGHQLTTHVRSVHVTKGRRNVKLCNVPNWIVSTQFSSLGNVVALVYHFNVSFCVIL